MNKQNRFLLAIFLIAGSTIGVLIISPLFKVDKDIGGLLGLLLGFLLSLAFPGLWKSITENLNREQKVARADGTYLNFQSYLIHPTQLPITLAMAWFMILNVLAMLFKGTSSIYETLLFFCRPLFFLESAV